MKTSRKIIGLSPTISVIGLPKWLSGKEFACQAGYSSSIPGLGRFPGEGNGNPFQYSYLDRGARQATVHGVAKESDTT